MFLDANEKEKVEQFQQIDVEQLQAEIIKLNEKNSQLEEQLAKSNAALNNRDDTTSRMWTKTPVSELDLSRNNEVPSRPELTEVVETMNETEDDLVLEFSPTFQAILEKHAEACDS